MSYFRSDYLGQSFFEAEYWGAVAVPTPTPGGVPVSGSTGGGPRRPRARPFFPTQPRRVAPPACPPKKKRRARPCPWLELPEVDDF